MKDFYSMYEGEPEVRFIAKSCGKTIDEVRMWEGYFDEIMPRIPPENGAWTGLALPYQLCEGWHDTSPWQVKDLGFISAQWGRIPTDGLSKEALEIHRAVLELLYNAVSFGSEVWIEYY